MTETNLGVEALIAQARGNRSAMGRLFERYRPFLLAMARGRIGPRLAVRSDASDIVQQTMAEALDRSVVATAGLVKRGMQALRAKMREESWL